MTRRSPHDGSAKGDAKQGQVHSDIQAHWPSGRPQFHLKFDMAEMQAANMLWKLETSAGIISAIGAPVGTVTYDADNQYAAEETPQDGTGTHPGIGHIMRDDARAYVSQDKA